jgi:hypothetical protein
VKNLKPRRTRRTSAESAEIPGMTQPLLSGAVTAAKPFNFGLVTARIEPKEAAETRRGRADEASAPT